MVTSVQCINAASPLTRVFWSPRPKTRHLRCGMCGRESLSWIFLVTAIKSSPLTGVRMARGWEVEDEIRLCAYGGIDRFHTKGNTRLDSHRRSNLLSRVLPESLILVRHRREYYMCDLTLTRVVLALCILARNMLGQTNSSPPFPPLLLR